MSRHSLTDREWNTIRNFLPAERPCRQGRRWCPHRQIISGILWILATGAAWRDVPEEFGNWATVYGRFRRWKNEGLWDRIHNRLLSRFDHLGRIDRSLWCVDGSVVRAHRVAAGALLRSGGCELQALGRSRGGFSTKIHIVADANGTLLSVTATPGQSGEAPEFHHVMLGVAVCSDFRSTRPRAVAGDKGYSSQAIRDWLNQRSIKAVIPKRSNERRRGRFAAQLYRRRNIVERTIGHLKEFRRIATRFDKCASSYIAFIKIAATRILLKSI